MPTEFLHGVKVYENPSNLFPIQTVKTSVIGLIGTAPLADVTQFPINTPVLVSSRSQAATLGATGTLANALDSIWDQIGATVVVVRVTEGANINATINNIIGGVNSSTGQYEGMLGFLKAEQATGQRPRILIAPGFTHQRLTGGVLSATPTAGGTGYAQATTTVTFPAPPSGGRQATGVPVVTSGAVTGIVMDDNGAGYLTAPVPTIAGAGTGATATSTIGTVRNPVVAELLGIAEQLKAVIVADGPNTTDAAAVQIKTDFGSDRVYAVDPWVTYFRNSAYVNEPASGVAAGLIAKSDIERGFWFSPSNQKINGITGVARDIDFVLGDVNSRANLLNGNNITTIIRNDGYKLWGNRSLASSGDYSFLSNRRIADAIGDSIQAASMPFVDQPMSKLLIKQVQNTVDAYLRDLKNQGAIVDGNVWFDGDLNSPTLLANGQLTFSYDFAPSPPAEKIVYQYSVNINYLAQLAA